jgi:hypothetical protein
LSYFNNWTRWFFRKQAILCTGGSRGARSSVPAQGIDTIVLLSQANWFRICALRLHGTVMHGHGTNSLVGKTHSTWIRYQYKGFVLPRTKEMVHICERGIVQYVHDTNGYS